MIRRILCVILCLSLSACSFITLRDAEPAREAEDAVPLAPETEPEPKTSPPFPFDTDPVSTAAPETAVKSEPVETERNEPDAPDDGAALAASTVPKPENEAQPEPISEPLPESEPEPKTEGEPVRFEGASVSFVAAGDNLIHPNIYIDAGLRGSAEKKYDFLPMYEYVAEEFRAADIAFINQETVMAGEAYGYSGWPCFNCPSQLGLDLVSMGIDIVNMANNHMLDKGAQGLEDTIAFWEQQPVTILGAYKDEEDAARIRVTEKDGIRFAWLSYTLSTNGIVKPASSPLVIPYIDADRIVSDLAKARDAGDFVIVSIHWGDENTQEPNSDQKWLSRIIADNGADLILGHHSHTLQPIEWIETERGRTLCIYSLGNYVSGMARPVNQVGGMFHFTVASDGKGGLEIRDAYLHPTVFYYGMDWYNTKVYPMENYTEEIAAAHGVAISGYRLTPADARAFVTNVIPDEFLPEWMKPAA